MKKHGPRARKGAPAPPDTVARRVELEAEAPALWRTRALDRSFSTRIPSELHDTVRDVNAALKRAARERKLPREFAGPVDVGEITAAALESYLARYRSELERLGVL